MTTTDTRSADIYREAIDYIYAYFEPFGYKQLKSGTIKKKADKLSYEIWFGSSHHNYLDFTNKQGSVKLEIHGNIIYEKKYIYSFSFSKPRSYVYWFELLTEDLELNKPLLDNMLKDLQKYFLDFIFALETDPEQAIRNTGLVSN